MRRAWARWYHTALRHRIPESEREEWMERYMARTMTLFARWRGSIVRGTK
jgi:hypothetical protein